MIPFNRYELGNGLRVLLHRNEFTGVAAVNVLYDVGSRDEDPEKTGFAHLFEHLMFGGSVNIPDFDGPLQLAGGENNAFTNNDITNYYLTIPQDRLETAFWLESDRMLDLAFDEHSLEVQRRVVVEEFKQRYLNQPYGDLWLLFRPLAYRVHPYRWATIGMEMSHIEQAVMDDVRAFYTRFYHPGNAILSVASGLPDDQVLALAEKWFGGIPAGNKNPRQIPQEPKQTEERRLRVERAVPFDVLIMGFHMDARKDPGYYLQDLTSDLLSSGKSSRLYNSLVREQRLFSELSAYITGDLDPGLFVIYGKVSKNVSIEAAEVKLWDELARLQNGIEARDMEKAVNRIESAHAFEMLGGANRAFRLGFAELIGDLPLVNGEIERYRALRPEAVMMQAAKLFTRENCSVLHYVSSEKKTP